MLRKVLVAIDGSEGAKKALKLASDLAKQYEAELHSISIEEQLAPSYVTASRGLETKQEPTDYFRQVIIDGGLAATASGARLTPHVMPGHEVETIVAFAERHRFDLLVIGFTGHSKTLGRSWGSTSQNLTALSPCTVLVVK